MAPGASRRRKRLGQHFLKNDVIAQTIVEACRLSGSERVVEIGPGRGFLTRFLAPGAEELVAVEHDAALAAILQATVPQNVRVVHQDILEFDYSEEGPFHVVVGNLPYSLSSPITFRVLRWLDEAPWQRAVLMYQKEFADRMLARPDTPDYGRLTVGVALRASCRLVRRVKPGNFDPPPTVESAIVELVPHARPPFHVQDPAFFEALVTALFSQRRKTLRKDLRNHAVNLGLNAAIAEQVLDELGLSGRRIGELSPAEIADLANALTRTRRSP